MVKESQEQEGKENKENEEEKVEENRKDEEETLEVTEDRELSLFYPFIFKNLTSKKFMTFDTLLLPHRGGHEPRLPGTRTASSHPAEGTSQVPSINSHTKAPH